MKLSCTLKALATLSGFANQVAAHSWPEMISLITNNKLDLSHSGYRRGPLKNRTPDWKDPMTKWNVAEGGTIPEDRNMCRFGKGDNIAPLIQAGPGDWLSIRYLENGHVTNLEPGRPTNSGVVFVYATAQPKDDDKFLAIHRVWNARGDGGDKRGRLIATRYYDDGRCYEDSERPRSQERKAKFPNSGDELMGTSVWCQVAVQIPEGMDKGGALYWSWDWGLLNNPNLSPIPFRKNDPGMITPESYTGCIDFAPRNSKRDLDPYAEAAAAAALNHTVVIDKRAEDPKTAIIESQLKDSFQVKMGALTDPGKKEQAPAPAPAKAPAPVPAPALGPKQGVKLQEPTEVKPDDKPEDKPADKPVEKPADKVTVTVTQPPQTVIVTKPATTVVEKGKDVTVTVTATEAKSVVNVSPSGGGAVTTSAGGKKVRVTTITTFQTVTATSSPTEAVGGKADGAKDDKNGGQDQPKGNNGVPKPSGFLRRANGDTTN